MPNEGQQTTQAGGEQTGTTTTQQGTTTATQQTQGTAQTTQSGQTGSPATTQQQGQQTQQGQQQAGAQGGQQRGPNQENAHRRLQGENNRLRREMEQMRNQFGAAMGFTPSGGRRELPEGVTEDAINAAAQELELVHPGLGKLVKTLGAEGMIEKLTQLLNDDLPAFRQTSELTLRQQGFQMKRGLDTAIKATFGDKATDKGKQRIYAAFAHALDTDDEILARYEAGDPELATDFIKDYAESLPFQTQQAAHQQQTTTVVRGRQLPRGGSASTVLPGHGQQEPALDPNDEDARHKRAFSRMQQRRQAATV